MRFIGFARGDKIHRKFKLGRSSDGEDGIELFRNCGRFITISGLQQNACENLGQIDGYLDELLERYDKAKQAKSGSAFDFNTAKSVRGEDYYRDLIENGAPPGGDRSELFQAVAGIWQTLAGRLSRSLTSWLSIRMASDSNTLRGYSLKSRALIRSLARRWGLRSAEVEVALSKQQRIRRRLHCGGASVCVTVEGSR